MLIGLSMMEVALLLCAGVLLDLLLGEARRWHPLVGFGTLAMRIERRLNAGGLRLGRGALAWAVAVLPLTALGAAAAWYGAYAVHALLLYFALGLRSLGEHNLPIAQALEAGELARARELTGWIVSRDTATASPPELAKASAESLLENGNDAVFGALFWFILLGGAGALLFRLSNTLDAMWGYRSSRFNLFGRTAARIDDVLNYVPARLTAISYVLLAEHRARAWQCWRTQAPDWPSPNAGPVMASGAGALGLALGGSAIYDGVAEQRPPLGRGSAPQARDIRRAWTLVCKTTVLWLVMALALALSVAGWSHA